MPKGLPRVWAASLSPNCVDEGFGVHDSVQGLGRVAIEGLLEKRICNLKCRSRYNDKFRLKSVSSK